MLAYFPMLGNSQKNSLHAWTFAFIMSLKFLLRKREFSNDSDSNYEILILDFLMSKSYSWPPPHVKICPLRLCAPGIKALMSSLNISKNSKILKNFGNFPKIVQQNRKLHKKSNFWPKGFEKYKSIFRGNKKSMFYKLDLSSKKATFSKYW